MACAQRHSYLPSSDQVRQQTELHHWRFYRLSACTPSKPHSCHTHHAALSGRELLVVELAKQVRRDECHYRFADRGNNRCTGWRRHFLCARRTVQDRDFFRGDLEGDARESDNGSLVNEPQRVVARCQRRVALRLRFCPRDLSGQRRIQIKGCTIRCPRRPPPP